MKTDATNEEQKTYQTNDGPGEPLSDNPIAALFKCTKDRKFRFPNNKSTVFFDPYADLPTLPSISDVDLGDPKLSEFMDMSA